MPDLTFEHIQDAFEKLPYNEKVYLEKMAQKLIVQVKIRRSAQRMQASVMFGRLHALEVLARVGVWMVKNGR